MSILDTIDHEEMTRLWKDGVPVADIAKVIGVSDTTVRVLRDVLGLPPRQTNPSKYPPALVERICDLWREGRSGAEIARTLGVGWNRNKVISLINRNGLSGGRSKAPRPSVVKAPRPPRAPRPKADKKPQAAAPAKTRAFVPTPPQDADKKRAEFAVEGQKVIAGTADAANDNAIPLLERRFGQCAWPVGTPDRPARQLCCGGPVAENANRSVANYCAGHGRRAVARVLAGGAPDPEKYERAMRRWAA